MRNGVAPASTTFESFKSKIAKEFLQDSAIALELFEEAVEMVPEIQILPGGEVETPIADALNWRYTRFGRQANTSRQYAALLRQESGEYWQAKLAVPKIDLAKGKLRKYESPFQGGSKPFLPPIPKSIRSRIASRYNLSVPGEQESFWDWVVQHPEIPIVFTEGGKKALCLLSLGYVAISLYGVSGGYRNEEGERSLLPELLPFMAAGRQAILAFDQDSNRVTRSKVSAALARFGWLLAEQGCLVEIARWDGQKGKGIDDFIATQGSEAWDNCVDTALSIEQWRVWNRLEGRLSFHSGLLLQTPDLSTIDVDNLPDTGIIAVSSPKGTGKTKFISNLVRMSEQVLAGGHRIALMRNLCQRLKLDYRGDLDKVNGQFITGSAYTLRVGFCVDSLLAIQPSQFAGCDLVVDEVVQVVRHLLTSSTCARDGKRPALLSRLRELVRLARRVILADADLDDATLFYFKELRTERDDNTDQVFLIRNDYQPQGYNVRFLQCPDRSAITAQLIAEMQDLPPGKVIYVATDSKGTSKAIAKLIQQQAPEKRVLLINSETSGGECEQEFLQFPDEVLARDYDCIISSPSVATGVSIEVQGIITKVYGIFLGASSTDADMAQALGRVREPVERIVWCANRGTNFSRISTSTKPLEFKSHLQQRTSVIASLTRASLREDTVGLFDQLDWDKDPHIRLFCSISAAQNFSMERLAEALQARLKFEGHTVFIEQCESTKEVRLLLKTAKEEILQTEAEAIVSVDDLSSTEILLLEQKESLSPEEQRAISKYYLKEFYCLESLTIEDVLWDLEGRRRAEILSLEAQLFPNLPLDRTIKAIERQANWKWLCPWDFSGSPLRKGLRDKLGLNDFLDPQKTWTKKELEPYAQRIREASEQIRLVLKVTISPKMSNVQVVHQLLAQLGLKVERHWSRTVPGFEKKKIPVYWLNFEHWSRLIKILQQRQKKRQQNQTQELQTQGFFNVGSPTSLKDLSNLVGDPNSEDFSAENLENIREFWLLAEDDPSTQEVLAKMFNPSLLIRALSG